MSHAPSLLYFLWFPQERAARERLHRRVRDARALKTRLEGLKQRIEAHGNTRDASSLKVCSKKAGGWIVGKGVGCGVDARIAALERRGGVSQSSCTHTPLTQQHRDWL